MSKKRIYIKPKIKYFLSFKDAEKDVDKYSFLFSDETKEIDFEDFFIYKRNFIISEPGYGKTRLLNEIIGELPKYTKEGVCIDLKKIPANWNIEKYLKDVSAGALSSTKEFKIDNKSSLVVCLDALDEVKQERFSEIVESIKKFQNDYPEVYVFVTCRWHYFQKYQHLFVNWDFRYGKLYPFSREQAWNYLEQLKFKEKDIKKIFEILSFQDRNLIIQTPRYLELLADYFEKKGVKHIRPVLRAELFEHFIYKKLEVEDNKFNTQNRDIIKRVLEKLALIMEIYQKNIISKDELMTFFDDLDSDLKNILLNRITIKEFFEKTMLKVNDDSIEFDNTEFQEYLAAKEIIRLGNPQQIIFDLAIDKILKDIYPSWSNTLSFVIDLRIDFIKPILNFIFSNIDSRYVNESYFRLLSNVEVERLSVVERKEIFEKVFLYYQNVLHWLKWDTAKALALYFDKSQNDILKQYCNKRKFNSEIERYVQLGNVAQIVDYIMEYDLLETDDRDYWKNKLIKFSLDKNDNGVLQGNSLGALIKFNDDTVIKKVKKVWGSTEQSIRDSFITLCERLNPEHDLSIKYFIESIKTDRSSIHARHGIYKIKSQEAINKLIDYFVNDKEFLNEFLHHESIYKDRDRQMIKNIEKVWGNDIEKGLRDLVINVFKSDKWYEARHSKFIRNIAQLLKKKNKNYIFDLIRRVSQSTELKKHIYILTELFQSLITKGQISKFIKDVLKLKDGKDFGVNILYNIKISDNTQKNEIYKEARKQLTKEFIKREKITKQHLKSIKKQNNRKLYQEFRLKLEPSPGQYIPDVFQFFIRNKEELKDIISESDKNRIIKLIEDTVFEKYKDPADTKLKINSKTNGSTNYTTESNIFIFGDALLVAKEFNLSIANRHRRKIINFIPFAYSNHREAIFYLIKNIKPTELTQLLKVYKQKSCDKWRHLPESIIEVAKNYKLREAAVVLEEFVDIKEFNIYDRVKALEITADLDFKKLFLIKAFNKYKKRKNIAGREIADVANKLLIEIGNDEQAIKWRFEQIIKRAFKFQRAYGVHSVTDKEEELNTRKFTQPLVNLKGKEYEKQFEALLIESFKLLKKDSLYYSYAEYIWQVVVSYYSNQKENKKYEPLIRLEKFISQHASSEGVNWFGYKLKELRVEYLNYIGKPTDIAKCIKRYNILKKKRYLEIATDFDLLKMVQNIIDNEIYNWIISDGVKMVKNKSETDIQKLLKFIFENSFLRRDFRTNEIQILREPQLLSDKRTDFLISYGFVKPIVVEIKLSVSSDLKGRMIKKKSYASMEHYMKAYNVEYGLFLVINNQKNVSKKYNWNNHFDKIKRDYDKIKGVKTVGLSIY